MESECRRSHLLLASSLHTPSLELVVLGGEGRGGDSVRPLIAGEPTELARATFLPRPLTRREPEGACSGRHPAQDLLLRGTPLRVRLRAPTAAAAVVATRPAARHALKFSHNSITGNRIVSFDGRELYKSVSRCMFRAARGPAARPPTSAFRATLATLAPRAGATTTACTGPRAPAAGAVRPRRGALAICCP